MELGGLDVGAARINEEEVSGGRGAQLTSKNLLAGEDIVGRGDGMVVHALRVATVMGGVGVGIRGGSAPDEDVAVLRCGDCAADLPAVEDGIIHAADGGGGVGVAVVLNIGGYARTAGGVCVEGMGTIDEDTQHAAVLAKHVGAADDLFAGKGKAETDYVN